jgi:hypothetical protein|tara:strand:- start:68 stop:643 length:576 start_codon:yes stop_codon:yes gene_type:complete
MGAGGASTGGGGGVGPAGIKTDGTYGTKKDSKKASSRNELRSFIKGGGVIGKVITGITGKTPYEMNLERRQKFVKSKGLTSEEINLDPSYLGSKEGLKELKAQGYTTASDTVNTGGGNDNNNQPAEPVIVKKNIGGTEVQTTEAKLAEEKEIDDAYDTRKTKRRGRRQTILTSQKGATGNLVLGKPTLLGA